MSDFNDQCDLTQCFCDPEAIRKYPEALRSLTWCVWKLEKGKGGRLTKVPYNPRNGCHASVDQPATFADLETALGALGKGYNGIGLRISENVGCIDIDNSVNDDGELSDRARAVMKILPGAFAELSPSGHGLHLYFLVPADFTFDSDIYYVNNRANGMEIYIPGQTRRFMTVTGNVYRAESLQADADALKAFCESFMLRPPAPAAEAGVTPPEGGSILTDEEVLWHCIHSRAGKTFERYYNGDWHKDSNVNWSQSEADLSVCRRLAFFTRGDMEQMDRLFRRSGLMRDKWDRSLGESTYGRVTMTKAIQGCTAFYEPKRKAAEDFAELPEEGEEEADGKRDPAIWLDQWLSRDLSAEEVLDPGFLELALWAREKDPVRYVRVKDKIPKKVGIRYFNTQLDKLARVRKELAAPAAAALRLEGCDAPGLIIPPAWIVDEDGVRHRELISGTEQEVPLCTEPVFISAKIVNMDDRSEKLQLTYRRNGKYQSCMGPRSELLNKATVIRYADVGLPVYSGNATLFTRYLAELEAANNENIPIRRCVDRAGWFGTEFFPYGMKEDVLCQGESEEHNHVLEALKAHGKEEVWMDLARQVRQYPFARWMLAASFAAPLLKLLSHRIIYLHMWYDSRSGKTAVDKFALSVWGNPTAMIGTYNATRYGLEQRCNTLRHLPVGLDELQSLDEKRMSASRLIYDLGNGIGKTQGKANGGIRKAGRWKTCILSTGEQPMTTDSTMDGVNSRLMEINACPLMDETGKINEKLGRKLHDAAERHYGFAGEKWIRFLREEILGGEPQEDGTPQRLAADFQRMQEALETEVSEQSRGNPHLSGVAVLALADCYASRCIFGETEEGAFRSAVSLGAKVLETMEKDRPKDSITAAWEGTIGWVAANKSQFETGSSGSILKNDRDPVLGRIEDKTIYVIARQLNDALDSMGFSYRKSVKGFLREGYILSVYDKNGNEHVQLTRRIAGIPTKVYALRREEIEKTEIEEFIPTDEPFPDPADEEKQAKRQEQTEQMTMRIPS